MAIEDEEAVFGAPKRKTPTHVIGEPLDAFSVLELGERIDALKREIERLEASVKAREATREAAAAFFRS